MMDAMSLPHATSPAISSARFLCSDPMVYQYVQLSLFDIVRSPVNIFSTDDEEIQDVTQLASLFVVYIPSAVGSSMLLAVVICT